MSRELPPPSQTWPAQYNPKEVEDKIYRIWLRSGFFNPDRADKHGLSKRRQTRKKTFCITVPPPNVTGSLHMGHALNATIQDILIRKKRMEGFKTLWLPGTDHAGIATQNVVEKNLRKQNISRHDLGREKFLKKVWEWKEKYGNTILDQFKKLGSSMDWSRTRFTMDPEYQKAVEEAFLHYYKKGWIYRGERPINWCSRCATSLSDLELEYREEKGKFYYIKYGPLTVGTARPETKLGDTALAVNPKDERYKKYIGEELVIQSVDNSVPRENPSRPKDIKIKIVADRAADPEFGTGIIKVTPAHDLTDFEIYQRHPEIPILKVIGENGRMNENAGPRYAGLKIIEAREQIIKDLTELELMERVDDYTHNVSLCYRCETVIEPLLSKQWFLKMEKLADAAIKAIKSGKVRFHPKRWEKIYFDWLKNIKDWCISRQIWWGHKIPLGHCIGCDRTIIAPKIKSHWFFVRHGETDWNREHRTQGQTNDIPLNEIGKNQARTTAQALKNSNIDLVISSDLLRAKETAEIIAKELGAELIFDQALRERHYGILEGMTRQEVEGGGLLEIRKKIHSRDFVPPGGGESIKDIEKRVLTALRHHRNHHEHRNVAIVSHGEAISHLLRMLKNESGVDPIEHTELRNAEFLKFSIGDKPCHCGNDFLEEETDVLDTWFSSALWPVATLGWPQKTKDLKEFYPTRVLSTARDIINLWVGRMIFSGLEFTGKVPFKDVIIHATILTKEGKRMSKSLGTGVDPMTLIEKYGADATRFGLIWQAMGGQDIHWSEEHVVAGKKFCNKIWNASRFVLLQIRNPKSETNSKFQTSADKKMLASLAKTKKSVSALIEKYEFGQALHEFYDFFWHEFCDVYIEESKKQPNDTVAIKVLVESLKLLHPFMPFITEEIWGNLPIKNKKLLIVESWPK